MQHTWPDGVLYNSTIHDHAAHAVLSIGNFPGDFQHTMLAWYPLHALKHMHAVLSLVY